MGIRCGIDLGTTYSAISWYDDFNNRVDTIDLESADGKDVLRSVVFYPPGGEAPIVGETAVNRAKHEPDRVVIGIKRSMGTAYQTPPIDGVSHSPQEVSAEILKVLARDAEKHLGEQVKEVVITVPAHFGDAERAATEEAGRLAGLDVVGLLPEPHAAALAYAVQRVADIQDRYVLVYDLGGGTFDVTLIHATTMGEAGTGINLNIETLCKQGHRNLGGLNWDAALAELVSEKVSDAFNIQIPSDDPILLENCEKAKRDLSRSSTVTVVADLAGHQIPVSVSEFEDRTSDLLLQTGSFLEQVISEAAEDHGITKDQIDVMLCGGSSRMPMVEKKITQVMGKAPFQYSNLDLLVTVGAAYWAYLLDEVTASISAPVPDPANNNKKVATPVTVGTGGLTDISMFAVGVEVERMDAAGNPMHCNAVIVPSKAKYGQCYTKVFATTADNMTEIPIQLYKGDSNSIDECEKLMTFLISDLPPGRPAGQHVEVTLQYDNSGIIRGKAVDLDTNKEVSIEINRT